MTYTIRTDDNLRFVVLTPGGNVVRTTNGEAFVTTSSERAEEAAAFLSAGKPRRGAHWLKSTFGLM